MTPFLMPIHVLACALDPDALKLMEEHNAKSKGVKHHWSCNPPDYKSLASSSKEKVAPLWVGAFEEGEKEAHKVFLPFVNASTLFNVATTALDAKQHRRLLRTT